MTLKIFVNGFFNIASKNFARGPRCCGASHPMQCACRALRKKSRGPQTLHSSAFAGGGDFFARVAQRCARIKNESRAREKIFHRFFAATIASALHDVIHTPPASFSAAHRSLFQLGRDPLTAESTPVLTATFLPHYATNLPRFGALFTIPLDRDDSLLLPQVTEKLGTRWRADQVELWTHSYLPDGRYEFFAADAVPSDLPDHRFMRLLIAADRDRDGLPDDWEAAHGLDSTDPFDAFADADGDGDANLDEFRHGTDAFNPSDNTRREELPRAPRNAVVSHLPDGTHDVDWEDTSHNENFFAIYDTDANGAVVERGRVGPNLTRFHLPGTITEISVRSGNEAGLSEAAEASDPGDDNDPNGLAPNHVIKDGLPTPELTKVQRLDLTRVKIEWKCGLPTLPPGDWQFVNLILFRQAGTGAWQRIPTVDPWAPSGVFEDAAAPIAALLRYSAITEYVNPAKPGDNAGSDAAPCRELDYGPATYGMKGRRAGDPDHSLAAPGHEPGHTHLKSE